MCANYTPPTPQRLHQFFDVASTAAEVKTEIYPGHLAPIIRLADDGSGSRECVSACFGMVPHWAELRLARHTYNARSETVASKPSFRHAFAKRQFCVIPAESFFEPNYESGRAVRWKIAADAATRVPQQARVKGGAVFVPIEIEHRAAADDFGIVKHRELSRETRQRRQRSLCIIWLSQHTRARSHSPQQQPGGNVSGVRQQAEDRVGHRRRRLLKGTSRPLRLHRRQIAAHKAQHPLKAHTQVGRVHRR